MAVTDGGGRRGSVVAQSQGAVVVLETIRVAGRSRRGWRRRSCEGRRGRRRRAEHGGGVVEELRSAELAIVEVERREALGRRTGRWGSREETAQWREGIEPGGLCACGRVCALCECVCELGEEGGPDRV